ncbi:MAG: ATP-binding protein, partial [Lachnospiraceae bacterium]
MANTNMVFNSFRMNMDRPQHAKVNGYLANFNKTICGSKNQLIIDSIEYYVENYGKEKILKKEEETNRIYVTVEDLEQLRAELFEAAMTEAR